MLQRSWRWTLHEVAGNAGSDVARCGPSGLSVFPLLPIVARETDRLFRCETACDGRSSDAPVDLFFATSIVHSLKSSDSMALKG